MVEQVTDAQKLMVLVLLVLQNASVVIMGRYSRGVMKESYLGSTVVIMTELLKLLISLLLITRSSGSGGGNTNSYLNNKPWSLTYKLIWLIKNSGYTWIPATCYFIQNTLQYTALENLSSSVYAVMAQMKILTAAIFSYIILSKKLSIRKWRALILLIVGGVLMENHTFEIHNRNDTLTKNTSDPIKGTIAIISIVCLSGIAGVVAQLLLQNRTQHSNGDQHPPQMSLWDRNFQMAFWSIVFGSVTLFWDRSALIENGGFFGGWTLNTWILVFLWAIGGVLVALCIKYTDVIIKGFASAISLILISIIGFLLLGDTLDLIFILGAIITIIATFNYNEQEPKSNTSIINNNNNSNTTNNSPNGMKTLAEEPITVAVNSHQNGTNDINTEKQSLLRNTDD